MDAQERVRQWSERMQQRMLQRISPAELEKAAAAMLRAMDALRARDNKSELRVVYTRLTTLRRRLAERNRPASG